MGECALIYVRDYRSFGRYLQPEPPGSLAGRLCRLIGTPVTVYICGGGESGRGFSGILIEVTEECVRLVTSLPRAPQAGCAPPSGRAQRGPGFPGTSVLIPLRQVAALEYADTGGR